MGPMSDPAPEIEGESALEAPATSRARRALLKRLADVVSLPASRVNAFERAMTADLLVEMLREAEVAERKRVALRLAPLNEIPNSLVRLLLRDDIEIAALLIEDCGSLTDADLVACARDAGIEHRRAVASRRGVTEVVAETLVEGLEPPVLQALLRNVTARLSQPAMEALVAASRNQPELAPLLLRRPELRPSGAYVMFWWCDPDARRTILQRFAVSREVLQEAVDDVFAMGAKEKCQEPLGPRAVERNTRPAIPAALRVSPASKPGSGPRKAPSSSNAAPSGPDRWRSSRR